MPSKQRKPQSKQRKPQPKQSQSRQSQQSQPSQPAEAKAPRPAAPAPPRQAAASQSQRTRTPTKAQQARAAEAARRRTVRNRIIAGAVVALVAVVVAVVAATSGGSSSKKTTPAAPDKGLCTTDSKSDEFTTASGHVNDPHYTVNPPAGGDHLPSPSPPGVFDAANTPPDGAAVHSMEHGYIVIWYRPGLAAPDLDSLKKITNDATPDVLLIPRPSLPAATPVVATAWHHRLLCSGLDEVRINRFIGDYANKGPEKVPH